MKYNHRLFATHHENYSQNTVAMTCNVAHDLARYFDRNVASYRNDDSLNAINEVVVAALIVTDRIGGRPLKFGATGDDDILSDIIQDLTDIMHGYVDREDEERRLFLEWFGSEVFRPLREESIPHSLTRTAITRAADDEAPTS